MFSSDSSLRSLLARAGATLALSIAFVAPAKAVSVSLLGSFSQDDDVRQFSLVLTAPGSVTVTSIGYGGGTNAYGNSVGAGGFDSMLFLYASNGALVAQSDDGVNAAVDPSTGLAADAGFTTGSLPAGVYTLALTQYDNFALGNLSDGFSRTGEGNFTPSLSGTCPATSFCDWGGNARTSTWYLNFAGSTLADVLIPEPGSVLLVLGAAGVLAGVRRRRCEAAVGSRMALVA